MLASASHCGSFPEALVAFRAARLHDCVKLLRGIASADAAALRARALLRLRSPAHALTSLILDESMTGRARGEFALLRAVASSRVGDRPSMRGALRDAYVYGASSADTALESEVQFYQALLSFGEGDRLEAEAACLRSLEIATVRPAPRTTSSFIPLAHIIARSEELLGILSAAKGDSDRALHYSRSALATLEASKKPDVYQEAFALKNLSIIALDLDSLEDAQRLARRVRPFAWTHDIAIVHFSTLETLGWCAAIHGDVADALRYFRSAADATTTAPELAYIAVSRALVARELGHHQMADEEIDYALRRATAYDWKQASTDARMALLWIAHVAAGVAPTRARQMLDIYARALRDLHPASPDATDTRFRAQEAYVHGIVLRAEGQLDASVERLKEAFAAFTRFGYEWRAARAALELTELGAGDVFRSAVRRDVYLRPASIFADRARRSA